MSKRRVTLTLASRYRILQLPVPKRKGSISLSWKLYSWWKYGTGSYYVFTFPQI